MTTWTSEAMDAGTYADVNGLHLYYEIHGTGKPLVRGLTMPTLIAAADADLAPTSH